MSTNSAPVAGATVAVGHNSTARSAVLFERALRVMPGGSTRVTLQIEPYPPYAASGTGCRLRDVDGNEYVDFANNFFALIHGHAHPAIVAAITEAAACGASFGLPTALDVRLAETLCARSPAFETIRFTNSGTEAVMAAIKAARAYTGRPRIAKIEGAYHGSYDHTEISLNSSPANWGDDDTPRSVAHAAGTPDAVVHDTLVLPFNRPDQAHALIERHAGSLACVLLDPLPSRAGMIPATPDYLEMLRDVTRRHGIVLLVDEIVSFRLGHGGAHQVFAFEPDLVTLGKIIGGGQPIGAVVGRRDIMAVFDARGGKPRVAQGGTFAANPITMAAGLASMELLTPEVYGRLNKLGDLARQRLRSMLVDINEPGRITGMGSLFRLHLSDRPIRDYRSTQASEVERARLAAIHRALLGRGVLVTQNLSGALSTPMTEIEVALLVETLRDTILATRPIGL